MDIVERVADRYLKRADIIGDPVDLLRKFDHVLTNIAELEDDIPKMREGQRIVESPPGTLSPADAGLAGFYSRKIYDFVLKIKFSLTAFQRYGAGSLFLAILQQYSLPPKVRKEIELAAKFFAKSRVNAPKKPEALDAYEKLLKALRIMSAAAHAALAQGKPHGAPTEGEGGETTHAKLQVGSFTLINTGGFDDKTMAECARVVSVAEKLLQSKGLGKVCYGDVLISNTLSKSNVLAFYLVQKDEIFVRANLKGKEHDAVHTLVHELGHRLYYKFLQSKARLISSMYYKISQKERESRSKAVSDLRSNPDLQPKPGDIVVSKGVTYEVTGLSYARGKQVVVFQKKDAPDQKASITLEAYAHMKGLLPKKEDTSAAGFITFYASKNAEENFAEMVAFYCMGKLPADQVALLEEVL